MELEAWWNDLEEQTAQNVGGFARDYNLLLHEMEEKPALSQQIRKFEQKLLPVIREKVPVRNFDTLEDLNQTAKVVESKLVQSGKSLGATNLTKGILQFRPEEQYMIGIHKSMQRPKQILTIDGPPNKRTKFPPEERNDIAQIEGAKPNTGTEMTKLLQQRIETLERQINQEQRNQCMQEQHNQNAQRSRFPYANRGTSWSRNLNPIKWRGNRFHSARGNRTWSRGRSWNGPANNNVRTKQSEENLALQVQVANSKCTLCGGNHTEENCWKLKLLKGKRNVQIIFPEINQLGAEAGIYKPCQFIGIHTKEGKPVDSIGDTGSAICAAKYSLIVQTGSKFKPRQNAPRMLLFGKHQISPLGMASVTVYSDDAPLTLNCWVFKDEQMTRDLLFGNNFNGPRNAIYDMRDLQLYCDDDNCERV